MWKRGSEREAAGVCVPTLLGRGSSFQASSLSQAAPALRGPLDAILPDLQEQTLQTFYFFGSDLTLPPT